MRASNVRLSRVFVSVVALFLLTVNAPTARVNAQVLGGLNLNAVSATVTNHATITTPWVPGQQLPYGTGYIMPGDTVRVRASGMALVPANAPEGRSFRVYVRLTVPDGEDEDEQEDVITSPWSFANVMPGETSIIPLCGNAEWIVGDYPYGIAVGYAIVLTGPNPGDELVLDTDTTWFMSL